MKNITLDCEKLFKRKEAHLYLAELFGFPEYYGKNLDALYDCLTELGECSIALKGTEILDQDDYYGIKVIRVLKEAVQANPRLKLEG